MPQFQNRGIATALIQQAISECRGKSPTGKLTLNSSTVAKGFYEKRGFVPSGEPKDLPGGCHPYEYVL